jgi:hypothetical protein
MAARISIADLSDATGIPADLLAAEVSALQRGSQLAPPPPAEPSCSGASAPAHPETPETPAGPAETRAAA